MWLICATWMEHDGTGLIICLRGLHPMHLVGLKGSVFIPINDKSHRKLSITIFSPITTDNKRIQ